MCCQLVDRQQRQPALSRLCRLVNNVRHDQGVEGNTAMPSVLFLINPGVSLMFGCVRGVYHGRSLERQRAIAGRLEKEGNAKQAHIFTSSPKSRAS